MFVLLPVIEELIDSIIRHVFFIYIPWEKKLHVSLKVAKSRKIKTDAFAGRKAEKSNVCCEVLNPTGIKSLGVPRTEVDSTEA